MELKGRRIHIVGSAAPNADEKKLSYVHSLVAALVKKLVAEQVTFVTSFGKEPFLQDKDSGPSIIFDWTVAETIFNCMKDGSCAYPPASGRLIATLATKKTDGHIPESRKEIYTHLRQTDSVSMEFIEPGWNSGSYRRQRQAQLGDILIAISGGEGVEHLAIEYSKMGKPVIPLDINIGSSQSDGSGGASRLFDRALSAPKDFFKVGDKSSAADLLDRTRTSNGTVDANVVSDAIIKLLKEIVPPQVFYVRLLNDKLSDFALVEAFFRNVVDPLVKELGYSPLQMGIGENEFAWMNEAIFDSLHYSSVVLVDLTGLRPNCFMELGYALGNKQRVIVTAMEGTNFPFDSFALEACLWDTKMSHADTINKLRTHWERNINMPSLVKPRDAK